MTLNSTSPLLLVSFQSQGERLDKFLAGAIPDFTRSRLSLLIKEGHVRIDGVMRKDPALKVREGQVIEISLPPSVEAAPTPQEIPLDILYEDDDVIAINKSAGMVVHPAPGNPHGTLVNALLSHCGKSLSGINGVKRPGIVHRLDKGTSGLLVAAKNDKAHQSLAHQLAKREMGRLYHALIWGRMSPLEGILEGPIGRDPRHRQKMAITSKGKFARTHYKTLKLFGTIASLIECRLETGRTHQIRVHFTSKGHPLIGDTLYGKPPRGLPPLLNSFLEEKWPPGRQALHAKDLSFIHPTTHEKLHLSTPLPEDMRALINMLESSHGR